MKKILAMILVLTIAALLYAATTETHYSKTIDAQPSIIRKLVVASDANEFTETLNDIYGYLERVVIDATGTDTAYSVTIKDEYAVSLFAKTDCNTADGDYSYAISASDTGSTEFLGVPVAGTGSVVVTGANDLTSLDVIIYYRQEPQQ